MAQVLETYPPAMRRRLKVLRKLILHTAASTVGVGPLEETLKWGEPAYSTTQSGSGSTIRIAWKKSSPAQSLSNSARTRLWSRSTKSMLD